MTTMTHQSPSRGVFVGVDTHADTDHAGVVDALGRYLGGGANEPAHGAPARACPPMSALSAVGVHVGVSGYKKAVSDHSETASELHKRWWAILGSNQ